MQKLDQIPHAFGGRGLGRSTPPPRKIPFKNEIQELPSKTTSPKFPNTQRKREQNHYEGGGIPLGANPK